MKFAEMNKSAVQTVAEGIETESLDFKALKEFVGKTIEVAGFYFHSKGKYGEQVVVVGREAGTKELYKIDMPKWSVEDFKAIKAEPELLEGVLLGELRLVDIHKKSTKNGTTVAYTYADGAAIRF